jgi:hypothetical protein
MSAFPSRSGQFCFVSECHKANKTKNSAPIPMTVSGLIPGIIRSTADVMRL